MDKYILKGHKAVIEPDVIAWAKWYDRSNKKRVVKQEELPNGLFVSTVFLGIDHNFDNWFSIKKRKKRKPLLFETKVFLSIYNFDEEKDMERYSTWSEAVRGHKKMVKKWLRYLKVGK